MSKQGFSVAVIGATGAVGEALLNALQEREFPVERLYALGRAGGDDDTAMFADRPLQIDALADFDFGRCQLAFFCAPAAVAKKYVPKARKAGCHVIDVSSQFRLSDEVPLLVPESALPDTLGAGVGARLLASPSAQALQLASAVAPLARAVGIKSIDATVLSAVSALGRAGVNELAGQTARLLNAQPIQPKVFPSQIAFNVLPGFDAVDESGYTLEELNIAAETKKLLVDARIAVAVNQVFVPVFYSHSQVVRVETEAPLSAAAATKLLAAAPGIAMSKSKKPYSPIDAGTDGQVIKIGRVRQAADTDRVLTLWTVADNIRKGAAVNSVQIAEALLKPYL